jgi:hypothetical protein
MKIEGGKNIGFCSCGFKRTAGIGIIGEDVNSKSEIVGEGFVSSSNESATGFSRICEKCGFDSAEAFQLTSNESEVTIFSCLKCGNKVRQSQGGSKA